MNKLFAVATATSLLALAGAAHAATTPGPIVVVLPDTANQLYTTDVGSILYDFDGIHNSKVSFTGNTLNGTTISLDGLNPNITNSAPPPYDGSDGSPAPVTVTNDSSGNPYLADPTTYSSVQNNQTSTFSTSAGAYLKAFSFYIGSPDSYNTLTFNFVGGGSQEFDGTDIWNGADFAGDRTKGFRVYYNFNGAQVSSIVMGSVGNDAFESDGYAGVLGGAVPEPASWALMILGFGAAGSMLRAKRRLAAAA